MTDIGKKRKCKILSEAEEFCWEIPNFRELIATNPELKDVKYVFETGEDIGLPSRWKVYLEKRNDNLGIFLKLIKAPDEVKKIIASFGFTTLKCKNFYRRREHTRSLIWGWCDALFLLSNFAEENLENGNLVIKIFFTLHKDVLVDRNYKRGKFVHESLKAAGKDLQKLMDSGEDADITFEMKDGQTLKAHTNILKTRSRVFSAMLQNKMKESVSGMVRVEDISYDVMKRILTFIYSGEVEDKWEEVIEEIVYAANKYELLTLVKFCDENLASTCKPENAWNLLEFAKLHDLKIAQVEIAEYFETHVSEILKAKLAS